MALLAHHRLDASQQLRFLKMKGHAATTEQSNAHP